ncbi:unnamed protein product, partial [Leptidea sinapis]
MSVWMRLTGASHPDPDTQRLATFLGNGAQGVEAEIAPGRSTVGLVTFTPETVCEPRCYTGLDLTTTEGERWLTSAAHEADALLTAQRIERFAAQTRTHKLTLHLHTTQVLQTPVEISTEYIWPRLAVASGIITDEASDENPSKNEEEANGEKVSPKIEKKSAGTDEKNRSKIGNAGLIPVSGEGQMWVRIRNPSTRPLYLQMSLGGALNVPLPTEAGGDATWCKTQKCVWSDCFSIKGWKHVSGKAQLWDENYLVNSHNGDEATIDGMGQKENVTNGSALPALLMAPHAEIDVQIVFAPKQAESLTTFLYLRNNLTILEGVQLFGEGAFPSFDLGGRRPGLSSVFHFEVSECAGVKRRVVARNT